MAHLTALVLFFFLVKYYGLGRGFGTAEFGFFLVDISRAVADMCMIVADGTVMAVDDGVQKQESDAIGVVPSFGLALGGNSRNVNFDDADRAILPFPLGGWALGRATTKHLP